MEDDADFLAIRLPSDKHNVRARVSFDKGLSTARQDIDIHLDTSSSYGNRDSKATQTVLELDNKIKNVCLYNEQTFLFKHIMLFLI